jgi:sugar phosphate isomerase/epimerase
MKLCAQTMTLFDRLGERAGITCFKETGFDGMDYSMFQNTVGTFMTQPEEQMMDYYKGLREMADEIGLPFLQMHAPFSSSGTALKTEALPQAIARSVRACGILGAKNLVVHAQSDPMLTGQEALDDVVNYYRPLIPLAQKHDVTICVENMPNQILTTAQELRYVIARLNELAGEKRFGACLDIGHAAIAGRSGVNPITMVHGLGEDLTCLHVHDNNLQGDQHVLPFLGKVQVPGVCRALKEIGYGGVFTYECEITLEPFPNALLPDVVKLFERVGRHLIGIYDEHTV